MMDLQEKTFPQLFMEMTNKRVDELAMLQNTNKA